MTPENEGKANGLFGEKANLSHVEFFRVATVLKKNRTAFEESRPCAEEASRMLSKLAGRTINRSTFSKLQKATGVIWQTKYKRRTVGQAERLANRKRLEVVARAVHLLFREVGGTPPEDLVHVLAYYDKKVSSSEDDPE